MANTASDIPAQARDASPVLILIPQGLTLTGVNTWAIDLARGLASRGRTVGLAIHGGAPGHTEMPLEPIPGVHIARAASLPIEDRGGDIEPVRAFYERVAWDLGATPSRPAVVIPPRHGDCFAAAAALTADPAHRLVLWQHVDDAYERAAIDRYATRASAFAGVSAFLAADLARRHPASADRTVRVPNPAHAPSDCPALCPTPSDADTVELLYAGRLEHRQKRVRALLHMSGALASVGFRHRLPLAGDGVAVPELRAAAPASPDRIRVLPPVDASAMPGLYASAHAVLLASRTEGLSCAVLESMAAARCPIITRTRSGADELIEDGVSGLLVGHDERDQADLQGLGRRIADAVRAGAQIGFDTLGQRAWARARERFTAREQLDAAEHLLTLAERAPALDLTSPIAAFSIAQGSVASGSVPSHGLERVLGALAGLPAGGVALHGAGQHTRQLLPRVLEAGYEIAGITDDDPSAWGGSIAGIPIVSPRALVDLGVVHVVISSWLHEGEIAGAWAQRRSEGLTIHRLYAEAIERIAS